MNRKLGCKKLEDNGYEYFPETLKSDGHAGHPCITRVFQNTG